MGEGGSKVGFGTLFGAKKEKIACKTQYRLARISIYMIGLYDSSEVNSSDDTK